MNITTAITTKGQVTIPVIIRRLLGLKPFDQLVFTVEKEKILATPVKSDVFYWLITPNSLQPLKSYLRKR